MTEDSLTEPDARIDTDRTERIGIPEAVYCAAKTTEQCVAIVAEMLQRSKDAVIATRCTPEQREALLALAPQTAEGATLTWQHRARTGSRAALIGAGTSDLPVVQEAAATLRALGHDVDTILDVGVAGLHRTLDALPRIRRGDALIVAAGMEGALPTVLGGLVSAPIVAVPTSTGYGTSFEGMTALLGMLASCAPGISVVGIDNGYGAACALHRILSVTKRVSGSDAT